MAAFSEKHPEMLEDEVFVGNMGTVYEPDEDLLRYRAVPDWEDWDAYGWETKRMGSVAYDVHGKLIPDSRPIFVKVEEYERVRAAGAPPLEGVVEYEEQKELRRAFEVERAYKIRESEHS